MALIVGVGRMADNEQAILVMARKKLSDDELRDLHEYLRKWQPITAFDTLPDDYETGDY